LNDGADILTKPLVDDLSGGAHHITSDTWIDLGKFRHNALGDLNAPMRNVPGEFSPLRAGPPNSYCRQTPNDKTMRPS
jgi:hypothetical protein